MVVKPFYFFYFIVRYVFILEAQTSVVQKREEESLTYLNKGYFYQRKSLFPYFITILLFIRF